jgi:DnaJ-like protein
VSFEKVVESQIQEAIAEGRLSGLPGEGSPLPVDPLDALAGTDWLGFHVLRDGEMLPDWLDLARDVERDEESLADARDRFLALVRRSTESETWASSVDELRLLMEDFVERARQLRVKQDRFNVMAPGPATQRPGIWVEQKRRHLAGAMRGAGAPEWAVERVCA